MWFQQPDQAATRPCVDQSPATSQKKKDQSPALFAKAAMTIISRWTVSHKSINIMDYYGCVPMSRREGIKLQIGGMYNDIIHEQANSY